MSEELKNCPICGEEIFRNESGQLQCPNRVYHLEDPKTKAFFKGQWLGLPNITVTIRYKNKPLSENRPICDACGTKMSGKEVELAFAHHHISYAAYPVQKAGEFQQKLSVLYDKIRKRQVTSEEAFKQEEDLRKLYFGKPKEERPVSSTTGNVPLDCPNCKKRLGVLSVRVETNPGERPETPSVKDYINLPITAEQERFIQERFEPKVPYRDWLEGKDLEPFIEKLEKFKEDIAKLPYVRMALRQLGNLHASAYAAIEVLQREIRTRPDQVYNLLKNPPAPPPRKTVED